MQEDAKMNEMRRNDDSMEDECLCQKNKQACRSRFLMF
jgi:hypothetical protein